MPVRSAVSNISGIREKITIRRDGMIYSLVLIADLSSLIWIRNGIRSCQMIKYLVAKEQTYGPLFLLLLKLSDDSLKTTED